MQKVLLTLMIMLLTACGFHPRGEIALAEPLHHLYIQSSDPYGTLVKELEQSLKMSHVTLTSSPTDASTILNIASDTTGQDLLSVNGTQQTRQYRLHVSVVFSIQNDKGVTLVPPQRITEYRIITIQSNQILGSSNEANLYFQQMRRSLASAMMFRLGSQEITRILTS